MTTRRDFLRLTACGGLGLAAFEQGLERFGLVARSASAAPPNEYRALVCLFMFGGNDAHNMVIPVYGSGYNQYLTARGASLAIPQATVQAFTNALPSTGLAYGLHPAMPELKALFDQGKLAVVPNVGPLNKPTTKAQYNADASFRPFQLFSHSDQVSSWMSPRADAKTLVGWGGLTADAVASFNTGTSFPPVVSLAGNSQFNVGAATKPVNAAPAPTALNAIFPLNGFANNAIDNARRTAFNTLRTFDTNAPLVKATSDITQQGLDIQASLSQDPVVGTFPNTGLGNQLKQIAKIIKQNQISLNVSRQVFFCSIGGFDTHQDELAAHTNLYGNISRSMKAFWDEMVAQGLSNQVTLFTMSDFGRTLDPSGSGTTVGTDHGWGSNHLVMGGAVKAADFYGVPGPNGMAFPDLVVGNINPLDTGRGRMLPTTAVDQYASTLGLWLGASVAQLNTIFPNLYKFSTHDLGFLKP